MCSLYVKANILKTANYYNSPNTNFDVLLFGDVLGMYREHLWDICGEVFGACLGGCSGLFESLIRRFWGCNKTIQKRTTMSRTTWVVFISCYCCRCSFLHSCSGQAIQVSYYWYCGSFLIIELLHPHNLCSFTYGNLHMSIWIHIVSYVCIRLIIPSYTFPVCSCMLLYVFIQSPIHFLLGGY